MAFIGSRYGRRVRTPLLAAIALLLWALPCSAQSYRSDAFTDAIGTMKHSVAPIICPRQVSATQLTPIIVGTVFFISSKGDFITADHILQAFGDKQSFAGCPTEIGFAAPVVNDPAHFNFQLFQFAIPDCVRDAGIDIARCHTVVDLSAAESARFEPAAVTIDPDQMADGSAVAFTGFPLGTPIPVSARGYVGGYQMDPRGPVQMIVDRAAWPGASGSPLFDYRGHVVGMMIIPLI